MKVSDLEGPLLDYWVAKAEGLDCGIGPTSITPDRVCGVKLPTGWFFPWSPSTDWTVGGPIIERTHMIVTPEDPERSSTWLAGVNGAIAEDILACPFHSDAGRSRRGEWHSGPTPLIAAMRSYVASKFGDTVPDL